MKLIIAPVNVTRYLPSVKDDIGISCYVCVFQAADGRVGFNYGEHLLSNMSEGAWIWDTDKMLAKPLALYPSPINAIRRFRSMTIHDPDARLLQEFESREGYMRRVKENDLRNRLGKVVSPLGAPGFLDPLDADGKTLNVVVINYIISHCSFLSRWLFSEHWLYFVSLTRDSALFVSKMRTSCEGQGVLFVEEDDSDKLPVW